MKNFLTAFRENATVGTICAVVYGFICYFLCNQTYTDSFIQMTVFFLGYMGSSTFQTWIKNHPDQEKAKKINTIYIISVLVIFVILIGLIIII
jgi:hypothetical protein